ncbi:hypothetical protein [Brevibacillus laterosporus]|uniref:hypothetical protein n=1 Tax=Brevibacillus laterosporus TaxID=1465 RepID=UPI001EF17005|nr:hypothetical protein [Brevibacillus laterosporus]
MFIKLDVEDGIEIHSDKAIMFSAEKDLEIETDTKFEIKAQEAIYLLCKESSIVARWGDGYSGNGATGRWLD